MKNYREITELILDKSKMSAEEKDKLIDDMYKLIKHAINENCLKCGMYHERHLGRCDGCLMKL